MGHGSTTRKVSEGPFWGVGDAEPHQMLWAPLKCFFWQEIRKRGESCQSEGALLTRGDQLALLPGAAPLGSPPQNWGQMLQEGLQVAGRWILGNS